MIKRLLIANRGEIACRIIATARRMGIECVAVYSDADRAARHVRLADQAIRIGPPPSRESYLSISAILNAARESGADAVHPGYGFLSENADFVDAVTAAGLIFVGPPASAIRAMGLKDAAKSLMADAGVPTVPGYHGDDQSLERLEAEAARIGYPVFIKARAGGGGKGMRHVAGPEDFASALAATRRESAASFGDDQVLLEKAIESPRHVEVQIFADSHGETVHLFERDCTLQRRHQKVLEETPAPGIDAATRKAMTDTAITAASAIGYIGAGTVEFIADGTDGLKPDGFWFMEMNTRLQVEHPVTEAVTGIDLVEWQLRVASGEPLPRRQEEITLNGHAIEARLYAEDPARNFLPSPGRVERIVFHRSVRADSAIEDGDSVSAYYDPMVAKIISHEDTRLSALARLDAALNRTHVHGLTTNLGFLSRLCRHPDVSAMRIDTSWIDRSDDLLSSPGPSPQIIAIAALLASGLTSRTARCGWRHWGAGASHLALRYGENTLPCRLTPLDDGGMMVATPEGPVTFQDIQPGPNMLKMDGQQVEAEISPGHVSFNLAGEIWCFARIDRLDQQGEGPNAGQVTAPMTGVIRHISVKPGDHVSSGDALIALEAMKMEHILTAPRDGVIDEVTGAVGDTVADSQVLITFKETT
ncbi:biotin carboxylase N-terminal domain-containing protein [Alphaproteobacteria bacterium LSUCC0684]